MAYRLLTAMIAMAACPTLANAQDAEPQAGAAYIAGTAPAMRPEGAPVITAVQHDEAWFAQAMTGISEPYPAHLQFLDDEGDWFTPFNHPGMHAPYDIRGWYQTD
ncbi:hypothetical protein [Paracoccus sp. (in: a-proteobacteria)]|uniref:hypothetical protein n=1 Tax=Paracoccus sp. TaxID=267 RepID=UPI003A86C6DD